jgi:hypothetical protein
MKDNFDLKNFLKKNKTLENLNPILKKSNLSENSLRNHIKNLIQEIITEEFNGEDYELESRKSRFNINPEIENIGDFTEEDEDYSDYFFDIDTPEDIDEAKSKKDKSEDEESEDEKSEEQLDMAPKIGGDEFSQITSDLEGEEGEVMKNLMNALQSSKAMGNEKLTTQIANTIKFFIGEFISTN